MAYLGVATRLFPNYFGMCCFFFIVCDRLRVYNNLYSPCRQPTQTQSTLQKQKKNQTKQYTDRQTDRQTEINAKTTVKKHNTNVAFSLRPSTGIVGGTKTIRGEDLHMAQLMPLPLTVSCSSKSRLVLPSRFYLFGTGSPG